MCHSQGYNKIVETLEFTIRRDPNKTNPEGVEYWVYEEVVGVREQGHYLILVMPDISAFIPKWWIVAFKKLL